MIRINDFFLICQFRYWNDFRVQNEDIHRDFVWTITHFDSIYIVSDLNEFVQRNSESELTELTQKKRITVLLLT